MLITKNLKAELIPYLSKCEEFWCAMALINENGYSFIQSVLPDQCKQRWIVGVDLPTSTFILRNMQTRLSSDLFQSVICKIEPFHFHPKLYLFKINNSYTAFVGSSNLTDGGLSNNIELNYKITRESECDELKSWFTEQIRNGFPLSNENLKELENEQKESEDLQIKLKARRKMIRLSKKEVPISVLDNIDFTDRFFKKEDHLPFRKVAWYSNDPKYVEERKIPKKRFEQLHDSIYSQFTQYGLQSLHPNPDRAHLISTIHQIDPTIPRALDAMWLSYGKPLKDIRKYQKEVGQEQKGKQTFIHHARLQLRIELEQIGIWLLFAKENDGGLFDRHYFRTMMDNHIYRQEFHEMLMKLPHEYFIVVGGEKRQTQSFGKPEELHTFCERDSLQDYFIIGKNYQITEPEMSEEELPKETLRVFKLLFPFYEKMRHRI